MRLSKAASFLSSQSQSLSPLIRSSNATATAATKAAATATRPLTLTALPKRTGKPPFEEEEILLQDDNNDESHLSNKKNFFCPVSPGDVVAEGKYSMISKLGWGRNSTVWLAEERGRDKGRGRWRNFWQQKQQQSFVAIKFNNCNVDQDAIRHELDMHQRLATADPTHRGSPLVRRVMDSFEIRTKVGTHLCLVYQPLRETLGCYQWRFPGGRIPIPLLKVYVHALLVGLDYLHSKCHITHTDLKLDNILVSFEHDSVLPERARQLQHSEQMFQETPYGRIFQSYSDFGPLKSYVSVPMITDFDQADDGDFGAYPIQPDVYRAPEVLLGWGWSHSADIWNFGNLIWRLASGADLFQPSHPTTPSMYDPVIHLAQMCSVLGFPSPALLKQRAQSGAWKWTPALENSKGELCTDACSFYGGPHFDPSTGEFLHPDAVPSPQSLHDRATFVGEEERASFVDFMSKMLTWDPAARLGADDLSHHPWLVLGGRIK